MQRNTCVILLPRMLVREFKNTLLPIEVLQKLCKMQRNYGYFTYVHNSVIFVYKRLEFLHNAEMLTP